MWPREIQYSEKENVSMLIIVKWNLAQVPVHKFKSFIGHFNVFQWVFLCGVWLWKLTTQAHEMDEHVKNSENTLND